MMNSIFCFKVRLADQKKTGPSELGSLHDQKSKVTGQVSWWESSIHQQKVLTVNTSKVNSNPLPFLFCGPSLSQCLVHSRALMGDQMASVWSQLPSPCPPFFLYPFPPSFLSCANTPQTFTHSGLAQILRIALHTE